MYRIGWARAAATVAVVVVVWAARSGAPPEGVPAAAGAAGVPALPPLGVRRAAAVAPRNELLAAIARVGGRPGSAIAPTRTHDQ